MANSWLDVIGNILGLNQPLGGTSGVNNLYNLGLGFDTGAAGGFGSLMNTGQSQVNTFGKMLPGYMSTLDALYGLPQQPGMPAPPAGFDPYALSPMQQTQLNSQQDLLNRRLNTGLQDITADQTLRGVTSGSGAANDLITQASGAAAQNQANFSQNALLQRQQGGLNDLNTIFQLGNMGFSNIGQGASGLASMGNSMFNQGFGLDPLVHGIGGGQKYQGDIIGQILGRLLGSHGMGAQGSFGASPPGSPPITDPSDPNYWTQFGYSGGLDPTNSDPFGILSGNDPFANMGGLTDFGGGITDMGLPDFSGLGGLDFFDSFP